MIPARTRYAIVRRPDPDTAGLPGEPVPPSHPYLLRRLLPLPDSLAAIGVHRVEAGERLDQIATRTLGDPLAYWRLADINGAMDPFTLCAKPGRTLATPAAFSELETTTPDFDGQNDPEARP